MKPFAPSPNLFVIGAAKCGTTSLHDALAGQPEIFMSSVKEPNYFAEVCEKPLYPHLAQKADLAQYASLFAGAGAYAYRGESSPSYLWDKAAASRIWDFDPRSRIIVLLRDPVARAYSHYLADVRAGLQKLTFRDALTVDATIPRREWGGESHLYRDLGLYSEQLRRYREVFSAQQMLIIDSSVFSDDSVGTLRQIRTFLGLPELAQVPTPKRNSNSASLPTGRISARAISSPFVRNLARRTVPPLVRQQVQQWMLRGEVPKLDRETYESTAPTFAEDAAQLRDLLHGVRTCGNFNWPLIQSLGLEP